MTTHCSEMVADTYLLPLLCVPACRRGAGATPHLVMTHCSKMVADTYLLPFLCVPACRRGAGATPHLVLTHYSEMVADKGIVLVRGDIIQPDVVSRGEVGWLGGWVAGGLGGWVGGWLVGGWLGGWVAGQAAGVAVAELGAVETVCFALSATLLPAASPPLCISTLPLPFPAAPAGGAADAVGGRVLHAGTEILFRACL